METQTEAETFNTTHPLGVCNTHDKKMTAHILLFFYIYGMYVTWTEVHPAVSLMFGLNLLLSIGSMVSVTKFFKDFNEHLEKFKK